MPPFTAVTDIRTTHAGVSADGPVVTHQHAATRTRVGSTRSVATPQAQGLDRRGDETNSCLIVGRHAAQSKGSDRCSRALLHSGHTPAVVPPGHRHASNRISRHGCIIANPRWSSGRAARRRCATTSPPRSPTSPARVSLYGSAPLTAVGASLL